MPLSFTHYYYAFLKVLMFPVLVCNVMYYAHKITHIALVIELCLLHCGMGLYILTLTQCLFNWCVCGMLVYTS